MRLIHRSALLGGTRCGAGDGLITTSGVGVTCPACKEYDRKPTRTEMLAALEEACRKARDANRTLECQGQNPHSAKERA